jgi:hypothetical protein
VILGNCFLQGKFGKEKSVMAFQNSFGRLPDRVMLEITEMMFKSSSSRNLLMLKKTKGQRKKKNKHSQQAGGGKQNSHNNKQQVDTSSIVKLPRTIFLAEPKIIRPYMRMMMHKASEGTLEGFQTAGCHSQYYNRMMQVFFT